MAGRGGRGDDGGVVSVMDQMEVQRGRQALLAEARWWRAGVVPTLVQRVREIAERERESASESGE